MSSAAINWPLDDTTATQSYSRVLNPNITPSRNIIINGTFDADTNWTKGTGWTIANGVAHSDGTGLSAQLNQGIPIVRGKAYQVTFTISNYVSSSVFVVVGATSNGTARSANGTYTQTLIAGTDANLYFISSTNFVGDIDNVTITQVNTPSSGSTPTQLLTDGNMETAGTAAWTSAGGDATLSKQSTNPHGGSQLLRVARLSGAVQRAVQNILQAGVVYRVTGYARSDGTALPQVGDETFTPARFTGTTSTSWQPFDITFVLTGSSRLSLGTTLASGTNYVEFDDVTVTPDTSIRPGELLQDADMEAAGTGVWSTGNIASISKQSTSPHGGSQVLRVQVGGANGSPITYQPLLTGKTYRVTGYARSDGTATPKVDDGGGNVKWSGTTSTNWQAFDVTFVQSSTLVASGILFHTQGTPSSSDYTEWDDLSVTEVDPLVGKPVNGVTLGSASGGHLTNAYTFDGTNDFVNTYSTDLNSTFNPDEGTMVAWAKVSGAGVWSDASIRSINTLLSDANDYVQINKTGGANTLSFEYKAGGTSKLITSSSLGGSTSWFQVVITWSKSADQVKAYINGSQVGSTLTGLGTYVGNLTSTGQTIGANGTTGFEPWSGLINDVRLYTRALSQDEITDLYSASVDRQAYYTENYTGKELVRNYSTGVTVAAPATEEVGGGPVAYWKLDEGTGQVTNDSSIRRINGTLGANSSSASDDPTWTTEDQCTSGKCLKFDGSNDNVNLGANSLGPKLNGASAITVSAWIKPNAYPGAGARGRAVNILLAPSSATAVLLGLNDSTGQIEIGGRSAVADSFQNTTTPFPGLNQWHFVTGILSYATNQIMIYLDGKLVKTASVTFTSSTFVNSSPDGADYLGSGAGVDYFNGYLDDVKIFPYARTAAQIKADYTGKGTINGAAVAVGAGHALPDSLSNGLVGYYKMNEATWSGTPAEVTDSSGNSNNGQAQGAAGGMAYPLAGKFGNGGFFDGVDDYVSIPTDKTAGQSAFTIAAWVKPSALVGSAAIIGNWSGTTTTLFRMTAGGVLQGYLVNSSGTQYGGSLGSTLTTGSWQLAVLTYDGNNLTAYLNGVQGSSIAATGTVRASGNYMAISGSGSIGGSSGPFSGNIDEVRIYNRALSPAEVKNLYNFAPGPVGWWKLDDNTGTTAKDSSGFGNTGTWSGSGTNRWSIGKYGGAGVFNQNAVTNDVLTVTTNANLDITSSITLSGWVYPTATPGNDSIINKSTSTSYGMILQNNAPFMQVVTTIGGGDYAQCSTPVPLNTWSYLTGTYDGANIKMYVNGTLCATTAKTGTILTDANNITISNVTSPFNGKLDDLRIYNYARTPAQILEDMGGRGTADSGGALPQPLVYYRFDEGQGTTAKNSGSGGPSKNLTLNTATSAWTTGKINKAWNATGANWLSLADDNDLDFAATDDFTITMWFKSSTPTNIGSSTSECVLCKTNAATTPGYNIYFYNTDGLLRFGVDDDTSYQPEDLLTSTQDVYDGNWHYMAARKIGTTRIDLYIDGVLNASKTPLSSTGSIANSLPLYIGDRDGSDNGDEFHGAIDELKIYRAALTDDQIKADYNAGGALSFGTKSATLSNLQDGLVGWWKMDEATWSGTPAEVVDSSGSGNHGQAAGAAGGMAYPTGAKYGNGGFFDGVDDAVTVPDNTSLDIIGNISFGAWIKANTLPVDINHRGSIVSKYFSASTARGYAVQLQNTGAIMFRSSSDCTDANINDLTTTQTISTGVWTHVMAVYDGSKKRIYINGVLSKESSLTGSLTCNTADTLQIGNEHNAVTAHFDGLIDDARIYNRALSPQEISQLYNQGSPGPVGQWKFDENNGTSVADNSGNSYTGTWSGTGTHWAPGKFGQAGKFNGSDDYVATSAFSPLLTAGAQTSVISWGGWFYPTASAASKTLIEKAQEFSITTGVAGAPICKLYSSGLFRPIATGTIPLTLNAWNHVMCTINGSAGTIYINGVKNATSSNGAPVAVSSIMYFGRDSGSTQYFSGLIDDVRVYTYTRSASEIETDYRAGRPSDGSPFAWYRLNECQGSTIHDSSGNGNDGTLTIDPAGSQTAPGTCATATGAWGNGATGKFNASLNFDGTDDYASIPNTAALNFGSNDFSISTWAKINAVNFNTSFGILGKGVTSSDYSYAIVYDNNGSGNTATTIGFRLNNNGFTLSSSGNVGRVNTWQHIVITRSGSTISLYVNGVLNNTGTTGGAVNSNAYNLTLGGTIASLGSPLNGQVDDTRIYNYALTPDQVKNLYNGNSSVRFGP
jgi:hypothetical protein